MAKIHDIEENMPHRVSIVICLKCYKRWLAVRPEQTKLVDFECPKCGLQGYTIETGEWIDDE